MKRKHNMTTTMTTVQCSLQGGGITNMIKILLQYSVLLLLWSVPSKHMIQVAFVHGQSSSTTTPAICACSPSRFVWTLDINEGFCPPSNIQQGRGTGIRDSVCIIFLDSNGNNGNNNLKPVRVEFVQIFELNQELEAIRTVTRENLNLQQGDTFQYTSIIDNNPFSNTIPGGLQMRIRGINSNGERIINDWIVAYTNLCNVSPIFQDNGIDSLGFARFEYLDPPPFELCPVVPTATPTRAPVINPEPIPRPTPAPVIDARPPIPTRRPTPSRPHSSPSTTITYPSYDNTSYDDDYDYDDDDDGWYDATNDYRRHQRNKEVIGRGRNNNKNNNRRRNSRRSSAFSMSSNEQDESTLVASIHTTDNTAANNNRNHRFVSRRYYPQKKKKNKKYYKIKTTKSNKMSKYKGKNNKKKQISYAEFLRQQMNSNIEKANKKKTKQH